MNAYRTGTKTGTDTKTGTTKTATDTKTGIGTKVDIKTGTGSKVGTGTGVGPRGDCALRERDARGRCPKKPNTQVGTGSAAPPEKKPDPPPEKKPDPPPEKKPPPAGSGSNSGFGGRI